jgi:hypothetical protein
MIRTTYFAVVAALLATVGWISPAGAQNTRAPSAALVQGERNAVDLKQGMALADVQRLLGKPRRTALKDTGGSASTPSLGNLRWTYVWPAGSSSDNILHVEFVAKAPAEWYVNSWEWSNY